MPHRSAHWHSTYLHLWLKLRFFKRCNMAFIMALDLPFYLLNLSIIDTFSII